MLFRLIILMLFSFLLASCKETSKSNKQVQKSSDCYVMHHLKDENNAFCSSSYYYFTKNHDTIAITLEIINTKKYGSNLCIRHGTLLKGRQYKMLPFSEQLKILDLFLYEYSKLGHTNKIKYIVLPLMMTGNYDAEIAKEYFKTKGKIHIDSIICKSEIRHLLDSILYPHGLHIESSYTDKFAIIDRSTIKARRISVVNCDSLPEKLIEAYTCFKLKSLEY